MAVVELDPKQMARAGAEIISSVSPGYAEGGRVAVSGMPVGLRPDLAARAVRIGAVGHMDTAVASSAFGGQLIRRSALIFAADAGGSVGSGVFGGNVGRLPFVITPWMKGPGQGRGIVGRIRELIRKLIERLPKTGSGVTPIEPCPRRDGGSGGGRRPDSSGSSSAGSGAAGTSALAWAVAQNGQHGPPPEILNRPGWAGDWGADQGWGYDCIKFAAASWMMGTDGAIQPGDLPRDGNVGNAANVYRGFENIGLVHHDGVPPAGAMIFWEKVAPPYGHVAVADGHGGFYETFGKEDSNVSNDGIRHQPAGTNVYGQMSGWVSLEEFRTKVGK